MRAIYCARATPRDFARSKRSRFITLLHAPTKSCTNFACASELPYTSDRARSCAFEPKIRSARVAVHRTSPLLRSRPSNVLFASDTAFHAVFISSRLMKKSLVKLSGLLVKTPNLVCAKLAFSTRIPPTSTVSSGAVRVSSCAFSRSSTSGVSPGGKGTGPGDARIFRGLLHSSATGQHDQVRQRNSLTARLRAVELRLKFFQHLQHFLQLVGLIDLPIFLRGKTYARAVCTTTLIGPTIGGRRRPSGRDQLRNGESRGQDFLLQSSDIIVIHQGMIHRRDGVLPQEFFLGNFRPKVACARSHVAMRQLEPGAGESVGN